MPVTDVPGRLRSLHERLNALQLFDARQLSLTRAVDEQVESLIQIMVLSVFRPEACHILLANFSPLHLHRQRVAFKHNPCGDIVGLVLALRVHALEARTLQSGRVMDFARQDIVYFPLDFCECVLAWFLRLLALVPDGSQPHHVAVALVVLELVEDWWHFKVFLEHFVYEVRMSPLPGPVQVPRASLLCSWRGIRLFLFSLEAFVLFSLKSNFVHAQVYFVDFYIASHHCTLVALVLQLYVRRCHKLIYDFSHLVLI